MLNTIPGAAIDFFPKLLSLITSAFNKGDVCIIECKDKKSGEITQVLALVQLNEVNRKIEFYPIARLYPQNPMEGVELVHGAAVLASQIPMSEWVEKSNEKPCDVSQMN